ncbi:MAG: uracil-DNA glycosylase [Thermodesulfobacteriota bacterium]
MIHLLRMVQDTYAQLKELGVEVVGCSPEALERLDRLNRMIHPHPREPRPGRERLEDIRADIGECTRCPLHLKRTNLVFGEGNPKAVLMFVGEGPGQDEDRTGRPFVGRSGQLLTKIIEAMQLKREQVYIANVVKCRPPGNRTPLPEEIETCRPFLERQIQVIQPTFLCTLGAVATHALLRTKEPISRMRGRFQDYRGIRLMPTFHPSYLLQNPEKKRETWEDMKKLMAAMAEGGG